ncbi:MAG: hypothetical protein ACRC2T_16815 [Thermoguttaceae bacterium]
MLTFEQIDENEFSQGVISNEYIRKTITALRLVFWGFIICIVDVKVNGFDLLNDFFGVIMILCGVIKISKIPVSDNYTKQMFFPVCISWIAIFQVFYDEIVLPLNPSFSIPPNPVVLVVTAVYFLCYIWSLVVLCRCMTEYCELLQWRRAVISWCFSRSLLKNIVFIPALVLSIPCVVILSSLVLELKNNPSFSGVIESRVENNTLITTTVHQDGTTTVTHTVGGTNFNQPPMIHSVNNSKADMNVTFGQYKANIDFSGPLMSSLYLLFFIVMIWAILCCWAMIHFLISIHRMTKQAKNDLAEISEE